jgi:ACS family hexuronate transporter-like MFS transporter
MQTIKNHTPPVVGSPPADGKVGTYRWRIVGLLFFATTINYLDRQVISLLKDDYLEPLFGWTETDYANVVIAFQIAYAAGMLGAGWLIDKIGTKLGYALVLVVWSVAAILHAFARSTFGFVAARALLGVSEAGNFPAAIKTTAEWFPKKERALATGVFNSGTNIGAVVAPLTVPALAAAMGWEWAFIITGAIGFFWLIFWFLYYDIPTRQKRLARPELEYITRDDAREEAETNTDKVSWFRLLTFRQTWAFIVGKFLTDPVWWFYLFWLPSFLNKEYGMTKTDLAIPIAAVYTMTTFGSVLGGWLSGYFINKGWPVYRARKTAMLTYALLVVPVVGPGPGRPQPLVRGAHHRPGRLGAPGLVGQHLYAGVGYVSQESHCLGGGPGRHGRGHRRHPHCQGGRRAARPLQALGSIETGYYIMFFICGSAYLLAWSIMHLLARAATSLGCKYVDAETSHALLLLVRFRVRIACGAWKDHFLTCYPSLSEGRVHPTPYEPYPYKPYPIQGDLHTTRLPSSYHPHLPPVG